VTRIDSRSGEADTVGGFESPLGLAAGLDSTLWVASSSEAVQIDAETLALRRRLRGPPDTFPGDVAAGGGSVWLLEPSAVYRVSERRGELQKRISLDGTSGRVVFGEGAAWVTMLVGGELVRIPADGGEISRLSVASYLADLAVAFGAVWVVSVGTAKVYRVDAATGEVAAIVRAGKMPWGIGTGLGSVWVTDETDRTLLRVDPESDQVVATIDIGHRPHDVVVAGDSVWVSVGGTRWPERTP
jgi:streptogramin lyase